MSDGFKPTEFISDVVSLLGGGQGREGYTYEVTGAWPKPGQGSDNWSCDRTIKVTDPEGNGHLLKLEVHDIRQ
jgi:hypothetical protein